MIVDIFNFPKSVIADIFSEWLSLRALGVLDSAVCMTKIRVKFEDSLCAVPLRLIPNQWSASLAMWMVLRKLQLRELLVDKSFMNMPVDVQRRLFESTGKSIRAITVDVSVPSKTADTILLDLCMFATSLESCIVKPAVSEGSACVVLAKNPGLRIVSLSGHLELLNRIVGFGAAQHYTDIILPDEDSQDALDLFLNLQPLNLKTLCLPNCLFSVAAFAQLQSLTHLRALHIKDLFYHTLNGCCFPSVIYLRTDAETVDTHTFSTLASVFP